MPPSEIGRRPAGRERLTVTVAVPDGEAVSTRGLASWLTQAAPRQARGEVTLAIVSDGRMRALNRSFRGEDTVTDVLSFPAGAGGRGRGPGVGDDPASPLGSGAWLGDVVIASGVASRQAAAAGHRVSVELRVLSLHGLLHLLGYDHERDGGTMARVEARLRARAGLSEGLISRASSRDRPPAARRPSSTRGRRS